MKLTWHEFNRLETIEWAERHFGSLSTNRQFPRRVMRRLLERGLARSVGLVEMCDDDGFIIVPSRHGEGFVITEAGRAALVEWRATHCQHCNTEGAPVCDRCAASRREPYEYDNGRDER